MPGATGGRRGSRSAGESGPGRRSWGSPGSRPKGGDRVACPLALALAPAPAARRRARLDPNRCSSWSKPATSSTLVRSSATVPSSAVELRASHSIPGRAQSRQLIRLHPSHQDLAAVKADADLLGSVVGAHSWSPSTWSCCFGGFDDFGQYAAGGPGCDEGDARVADPRARAARRSAARRPPRAQPASPRRPRPGRPHGAVRGRASPGTCATPVVGPGRRHSSMCQSPTSSSAASHALLRAPSRDGPSSSSSDVTVEGQARLDVGPRRRPTWSIARQHRRPSITALLAPLPDPLEPRVRVCRGGRPSRIGRPSSGHDVGGEVVAGHGSARSRPRKRPRRHPPPRSG